MVKRLIGSDTTGTDGSVSIPYTGTGAGLVNLSVETEIDGSIVSETLPVWDYLVYDKATTNEKSTDWTPNGVSESVGDDGTTLTGAVNRYTSTKALTGDFELTVFAKNDGNFRFGVVDASVSKLSEIFTNNPSGVDYKIVRTENVVKFYSSNNGGSTWTEMTPATNNITNDDCYVYFHILVADRTVTYKNLKAYHI